ncbi:MAG: hypothetical protein JOZ65_21650 [Chloroflexi bacterium]|nr:hypothetical protein [Chloroflexota bacterium]
MAQEPKTEAVSYLTAICASAGVRSPQVESVTSQRRSSLTATRPPDIGSPEIGDSYTARDMSSKLGSVQKRSFLTLLVLLAF